MMRLDKAVARAIWISQSGSAVLFESNWKRDKQFRKNWSVYANDAIKAVADWMSRTATSLPQPPAALPDRPA